MYGFLIVGDDYGERCLLMGVYGIPEASRRPILWESFKGLSLKNTTPWIMFGDLNEILFHSKKQGGMDHPEK